jgi:hypothetical protein|tara:strand:+ start:129 stop:725 length:597 start_codon:yes stop_codon:yes gene_type:complete
MNISDEIKNISFNFIRNKYQEYLRSNKILLIKENIIENIITELYDNNIKVLKQEIRNTLKNKHKEDYPSAIVENILLDLFQEKEMNIANAIKEILLIQNNNLKSVTLPIINNSLNLNISLNDNYIKINSINSKNLKDNIQALEIYKIIENYSFLYSINNIILEEHDDKINIIKNEIENTNNVSIEIYYLKENCKNDNQ